jgi:pimeloyl-ACP methyl ester carboxylesterase
MPEIELPQGTLRYRDTGGEGAPVVLLHGLFVDGRFWRKVTPALEGSNRCVVPDLPLGAHVVPARPDADLSLPGLARLVADLLDALELRDVTLVGCDTGGAIAQMVAVRHPERVGRLVLAPCDAFDNFLPPLFRPLQLVARAPRLATAVLQPLRLGALRRLPIAFGWLSKRPIEPRSLEQEWVDQLFSNAASRRDGLKALAAVDKRFTEQAAEELRGFDKPVLLAWAREDKVFPYAHAERLAQLLPDARVVPIEDSYAFVPEDAPEPLARAIAEFVAA